MRTNKSLATILWRRAISFMGSDDPKAKLAVNCLCATAIVLDVVDLPDKTIDDVEISVAVHLQFAGLDIEKYAAKRSRRNDAERFTSEGDAKHYIWNVFGDALAAGLSGQGLQDAVLKECGNSERLKAIAMLRMNHTHYWNGWLEDFDDSKEMNESFRQFSGEKFRDKSGEYVLTGDEDIETARAKVKAWLYEPEPEEVD